MSAWRLKECTSNCTISKQKVGTRMEYISELEGGGRVLMWSVPDMSINSEVTDCPSSSSATALGLTLVAELS